ncbi:gliding motility-associated C-terminal domain-containing protein [Flavobacterium caeni]|nr:gliding motility-associated C-terminal domain-containing protein [Flavobacterium caeni]
MAQAQLANFTLSLTKTDETCTGNGTINFTVTNTTPGANMVFAVYLLPNTTTPVTTTQALLVDGLAAGNYRVIATQTLDGQTNAQQQDIVIHPLVVPLTYYLSGNSVCNVGTITVGVNQGTAVGYEIISGPVIVPEQTSHVFTNLLPGEYVVRVHDACGDAVVQTFTLVNPPHTFALDQLKPAQCQLVDCNTITLAHTLTAVLGTISYPVTIQYTVHPPSGPAIVLSQTVPAGNFQEQEFTMALPFYHNQSYTIDAVITDHCGYVTTSIGNPVNERLTASMNSNPTICPRNFSIEACQFVPPVTLNFVSAPPGFNPSLFSAAYPGPYATVPIVYQSNDVNELPQGSYTVALTDACSRSAQASFTVTEPVEPGYSMLPQTCGFGQISMPGQNGTPVAQVVITAAPAAFTQTLPYNASAHVNNGSFMMEQLPSGSYTFSVTSICGQTYQYNITIPPSGSQPVLISYLRGCADGQTSVRIGVQNSRVTQVIFNAAPTDFPYALPYDASALIFAEDGRFYMNGLPQGTYNLFVKDECGQRTITIQMPGYATVNNTVDVDANCGSFNVYVNYASNEPNAPHSYWLQKYDPATGLWMHPITGVATTADAEPEPQTALLLINQVMTLNIASIGTFRVVKLHKTYGNGQDDLVPCVIPIKEFVFTGGPQILDANLLPCATNPGQVAIVAQGIAPLSYYITTKDGQPFYVDNGTSNVFTGLTPGIYNFQVRDVCQNIVNRLFDFGSIPPPSIVQSILCDGQNGQLAVHGFDFLNFQWWNAANPGVILSTTSSLSFAPFSAALHAGTYVVRIYSTQSGFCTDQTVSYTIPPAGTAPFAGNDTTSDLCGIATTVDLFEHLDGAFHPGGIWEELTGSGMMVGHSWLPMNIPYGTYRFRYTVTGLCGASDSAEVTFHFNPVPDTPVAGANVPVCAAHTIALTASTVLGATYQWTGPNGFTSVEQNPTIANASAANAGVYSVVARLGNCESEAATVTVDVNPSPQFTVVAACVGNAFQASVVPVPGSFDVGAATYEWTGPESFTASENPIVITGAAQGTYTVTVTVDGCPTMQDVVVENTQCAIPAGVSPNHDGNNDTFDLTGFGVLQFKIYSRYGRMVFEQEDYSNQWYGQDFNGNRLPDATYYYYIRLKTGEERTGWVYVIR